MIINRHLPCILIILMIILSGGTLPNKDNESVELALVYSKPYQNSVILSQNNRSNHNQVKSLNTESQKKQQLTVKTYLGKEIKAVK